MAIFRVAFVLFIFGGALLTGPLSCSDPCQDAKRHMCEKIPDMFCSALYMDTARERIERECGAADAAAYIPWLEDECDRNKEGLDCGAPGPGPGSTPGPDGSTPTEAGNNPCGPETFEYTGTADADGRRARLKLTFTGRDVTGTLEADPVCEDNIHLQRTKIDITATLKGPGWEMTGGYITGTWQGGDFSCDGAQIPGWPTAGNLQIDLLDQVKLKRIANAPGYYVFPKSNKVYRPDGC